MSKKLDEFLGLPQGTTCANDCAAMDEDIINAFESKYHFVGIISKVNNVSSILETIIPQLKKMVADPLYKKFYESRHGNFNDLLTACEKAMNIIDRARDYI